MGCGMLLSQMSPYVRYARYLKLNQTSVFTTVAALDARLFYVIDGQGSIMVDSIQYEMNKHALLIISSGIPYHIDSPKNPVEYIQINFDFTQNAIDFSQPIAPIPEKQFEKSMLADTSAFDDCDTLSKVLYISKADTAKDKLITIVEEYSQKLLYHEQKIGHILAECIYDCLRYIELGGIFSKVIRQDDIMSYIHNNFNKKLTNKSIGRLLGYHPNYVSLLIKQTTGLPLHKYIIRIRLEKAADLLVSSELSVSEIATACGFYDSAYFSGYFKKHFGTSPSKYRSI